MLSYDSHYPEKEKGRSPSSNPVSQKSYDYAMDQFDPFNLPCNCGCSGSLIRYGSYRRHVKADGTKFPLIIRRFLCQNCGRFHALIPSDLVPYSQISLKDLVSLIEVFEEGIGPEAVLDANPEIELLSRYIYRVTIIHLSPIN
ncbi:MAG: hypothetical protein K2M20_01410 [Lachnospiraceae bacterium]|nr:hypothetical protein [Lachnospiraceae bacterium]